MQVVSPPIVNAAGANVTVAGAAYRAIVFGWFPAADHNAFRPAMNKKSHLGPNDPHRKANVTLKDIADKTGFSKFTVSHAIRGNRTEVSEETMARILKAAHDMGYNPATAYQARRLALQRGGKHVLNRVVGLLFPVEKLDRAYFREFLRGVTDKLCRESFNLLINCGSTGESVGEAMPMLARGEVDGIIVMANMRLFGRRHYPELRALSGFGERPVVTVIDPMDGCSSVLSDDDHGAFEAVSHLLELGHRSILHFWHDPHDNDSQARRLHGATAACHEHGLQPDAVLIKATGWHQTDRAKSFELLHDTFQTHPDITAILAPNDPAAVWIVDFVQQLGMRVPDDVSVVGFDDTDPLWNEGHENILTTVRVPLYDIGFTAAKLLVRLAGVETYTNRTQTLPAQFVQRHTTTACRRPQKRTGVSRSRPARNG